MAQGAVWVMPADLFQASVLGILILLVVRRPLGWGLEGVMTVILLSKMGPKVRCVLVHPVGW